MASLYDDEDQKRALIQGLLAAGLGALGTRRGQEGQGLAQAGLLGLGGYSRTLESSTDARDRRAMREMQAAQWAQQQQTYAQQQQEYARKMQEQKAMEQARLQSFTGGSPQMGEGAPAVPPQFNREAYANNLEAVNPQAGMTYRQLIAKPTREMLNEHVRTTPDGKRVVIKTYKDGTQEMSPYSPDLEKPVSGSTGGRMNIPLDPYTLKPLGEGLKGTPTADALLSDARQREANTIARAGTAGTAADNLRKEFNSLPQVKSYGEVQPVIQSAREAMGTDTPAADLNLIYAAAKIFDPTSVVRESETTMVVNAGSPAQRFMGQFNYVAGGGRLKAPERRQLMAEIESRARGYESGYTSARRAYGGVAAKRGIAPEDVFIEPFAGGDKAAPVAEANAANLKHSDTLPPLGSLPEGAMVTDHQTGIKLRKKNGKWEQV